MGKRSHHIDFEWIERGEQHNKRLYKLSMYEEFSRKGIIDPPYNSQEIFKKISGLIGNTVKITINKDRNEDIDIPFVTFKTTKGEDEVVYIRRGCETVWEVLDKYCNE